MTQQTVKSEDSRHYEMAVSHTSASVIQSTHVTEDITVNYEKGKCILGMLPWFK